MPIITLNDSLKPVDSSRYQRKAEYLYAKTVPPESAGKFDWRTQTTADAKEWFLGATFADGFFLGHTNYMEYLCQAYAQHHSIVLTPDILWHSILCEIAAVVRAKPDLYATLFTTTPGAKQAIVLPSCGEEELPLRALVEELRNRVPTNTDDFLPSFSTTDEAALFVRYAAFADVCSPYYSYMTLACGYPAIDVRGEPTDYARISTCATQLAINFSEVGDTVLASYLMDKIVPLIADIVEATVDGNAAFFNSILTTQRCGSGGEVQVDGWWPERMYVKTYKNEKPENIPTHIARVEWKNLDSGRAFSLNGGLFTSTNEDGFAVPQWGFVKNERLED